MIFFYIDILKITSYFHGEHRSLSFTQKSASYLVVQAFDFLIVYQNGIIDLKSRVNLHK